MKSVCYPAALPTFLPISEARPLSKDLPFYIAGLLLFLLPFASTKFILWFSVFTMIYYVAVIGLLVLDRVKPALTPEFFRFVREEEELVEEFEKVVDSISGVKVSYNSVGDFMVRFTLFSVRVFKFAPQFFDKLLFPRSSSP